MHPSAIFSVCDFGAQGDGLALDTRAIQAAIDACTQAGGGTVFVPAGDYLTGTLLLKDNVDLHLAARARILGSTNLADYPGTGRYQEDDAAELYEELLDRCLIVARGARNVQISGSGVIDGQGRAFPYGSEGFNFEDEIAAASAQTYIRPNLLNLTGITNLRISGVTFQHSASWCCHIDRCKEVRIEGVHLFNRANQNNDGFDLSSCEDVMISNCHVDCGDDAFALKYGGIRITITNCIISTRWAAFRIGPEATGVFRDITVSNCVVHDTYGSGIKIQEVEGGVMENILFDNIVMNNVTGPISLRLGGYLGWKNERKESLPIGVLRNIRFSNIRAVVADNAYPLPHEVPAFPGEVKSCINISGVEGYYVENVTFSSIHVTFPGGGTAEDAVRAVPELRDHYPEYHMFGVLPAYAFYARHARGITLDNVTFDSAAPDLRPAIVCEDVADLELSNVRAATHPDAPALLRLKDVRRAFIHGCRPTTPTALFARLEGESRDILLSCNDLRMAKVEMEKALD
jgi:hypothetical protein